jgi:trehalose synthase
MDEIRLRAHPPERFGSVLDADAQQEWAAALEAASERQGSSTLWHINSTSTGGGVAEMLQSILCYLLGGGLTVRWLVVDGNDDFFRVTKQLHHQLHGEPGDGGLPDDARKIYEAGLRDDVEAICRLVQAGDTVVLHDPQTLGLAAAIHERGARIIWSCHVGADKANELSKEAWEFLAPYLAHTDRQVFSRSAYVPDVLDRDGVAIIPPCLDAFSPKNQQLDDAVATAIMRAAGIIDGTPDTEPEYARQNGNKASVGSRAEMVELAPVPADAPIVTQISRWDPLKDHAGVMTAFIEHVDASLGAHLVLAGPSPESIDDDPEGKQVLEELIDAWNKLPEEHRGRVHIACLPMDDIDENAAIVNALQRRSSAVVQKSLAEGFGLTVAEAMWKSKPTIGTRVGGIQDQIEHGVNGLLIDDAKDLPALGAAITDVLTDPTYGERLGEAARKRVIDDYLAPCHLTRYLSLIAELPALTSADR